MGKDEFDMYKNFSTSIQKDVARLKGILENLDSCNGTERGWLKKQTHGEIEDSRLIEGLTGDKYIYKRRGKVDSTFKKQNNIRFVLDVSASMYRFNGYDQRLTRCLEAALSIMESFCFDSGRTGHFNYSMTGHNGDASTIPLVDWNTKPHNEKQRLQILQRMVAHSQYCRAGDNTLEAIEKAIDEVSKCSNASHNASNGTVICLSDANLARYGIDPRHLGRIVESGIQKNVKTYMIFIASFGEEADDIERKLPVGSAHACMNTRDLPRTLRDILTSGVLK